MANISPLVLNSLCVLMFFSSFTSGGFLEKFCAQKCNQGLGGNLCRCNGFHFAGKRAMSIDDLDVQKNLFLPLLKSKPESRQTDLTSFDTSVEEETNGTPSGVEQIENAKIFIQWLLDRLEQERADEVAEAYLGLGNADVDMKA